MPISVVTQPLHIPNINKGSKLKPDAPEFIPSHIASFTVVGNRSENSSNDSAQTQKKQGKEAKRQERGGRKGSLGKHVGKRAEKKVKGIHVGNS